MTKPLGVIAYFLFLTVLLFPPFFLKGHIPFPGDYLLAWHEPWHSVYSQNGVPTIAHKPVVDDALRHLYPLRTLAWEQIKEGKLPIWNPYNANGTPLLAIMHQGYLNPTGVVFLFFPPPIAWTLYLMIQIPLLGLATYWYCRTIRLKQLASLFAATALLFSGFVIVRIEYAEFLYILACLPILLALVEKIRAKVSPLWFFVVPPTVAFLFFAGQPHMIVYVLGTAALYALVRLWGRWRKGVLLAGTFTLGVGLAAVQLVPGFELFQHATISRESSRFIFEGFLLPLKHFITIVIPNFFGNQATYNFFGPGGDYVETAASVGALPVFFSLIALLKRRQPIMVFFLTLAWLSFVGTFDWLGTRWLYRLPIPVLSADVPSRIFVLSTFALAILAGIGFDAWQNNRVAVSKTAIVLFLLFFAFLALTVSVPCPEQIPQCRLVSLRNSILEVGVAAIVLFAMRNRKLMVLPLVAVFVLGLYNAKKFLPFSPSSSIYPKLPVLGQLQRASRTGRVFTVGDAHFRTNILAHFKISTPEYFDPLHLRRVAELVSFANTGLVSAPLLRSDIEIVRDATVSAAIERRRQRLFDLTNTKYLLYKNRELPATQQLLWQDVTWSIVENITAAPHAYLVDSFETEPNGAKLLAKLFAPAFDPSRHVLLEEGPLIKPKTSGVGSITVDTQRADKLLLTTKSSEDNLLVLTDSYYPGWKAAVDGEETKIYRANYAFRAVVVPKGEHRVQFYYDPISLRFGLLISVFSGLTYLACPLFFMRWGNRGNIQR